MKKIADELSFIPIAPVLFAISFVLALFSQNIEEVAIKHLTFPVLLSALFAVIISFLSMLLLKNRRKGIVFACAFIVLFFSYGDVLSILINMKKPFVLPFDKNFLLFPTWIILLLGCFSWIKKNRRLFIRPGIFLLIMSFFAILFPIIGIIRYETSQEAPIASPLTLPDPKSLFSQIKELPDIYYIVPEDYASSKVLQNYFHYDNSGFTDFLTEKGFYVTSESASNYPKTFLSLASTLNMEYLDYLSSLKNSSDQTLVNSLIEDNHVVRFLQGLGYHYYQMGSWWDPTKRSKLAEENFILEEKNSLDISTFSYTVVESTMANPFITKLFPKVIIGGSNDDDRRRILYQFAKLPEVINLPQPKFIFLHIIAPHGPYVFGKNCEPLSQKQTDKFPEEENYVNQTHCINQKIKAAITTILTESSKPPIILLQTDEGVPFLGQRLPKTDSWKDASDDLLNEKFPMLSAYYLPGKKKTTKLYPSISPVNSFRVIFNEYFHTNLPLLPDKSYIFPDLKHVYEFTDITEKLH